MILSVTDRDREPECTERAAVKPQKQMNRLIIVDNDLGTSDIHTVSKINQCFVLEEPGRAAVCNNVAINPGR